MLIEDKRIEAFELRKNKDNNRKFNKQVKELRKAEGAQSRKAAISEVSSLRKDRGGADGEEGGVSKEDRLNKIIESGPATKSKKRVNMVRTFKTCIGCFLSLCMSYYDFPFTSYYYRTRNTVSVVLIERKPS